MTITLADHLFVNLSRCVIIGKENNPSKGWRSTQQFATHSWNRFLREYQQVRDKWHKTSKILQVDDLVWILEDFNPRSLWPLARVIQVFPGTNGIVWSVILKTSTGERIRPAKKLRKNFPEWNPNFGINKTVPLKTGKLGKNICPSNQKVFSYFAEPNLAHPILYYLLFPLLIIGWLLINILLPLLLWIVVYKPSDRFIPSLSLIDHPLSTAHFKLLILFFSRV